MAHHPGDMVVQTVNGGSISPFTWMIIIAILVGIGYFIYWLFSKNKKKW